MNDQKIEITAQAGILGEIAVVRLRPNLDLVVGVEEAAAQAGFQNAIVRSAVGSLVDAMLAFGETQERHEGPGVEILSLTGEVRGGKADLRGTISKPDQSVHGGQFVPGENPICITLELVLQEWLPN